MIFMVDPLEIYISNLAGGRAHYKQLNHGCWCSKTEISFSGLTFQWVCYYHCCMEIMSLEKSTKLPLMGIEKNTIHETYCQNTNPVHCMG
jgi:hypothetical protein